METKRIENSVGWRLGIFAFIAFFGQVIVARIISVVATNPKELNMADLSLILPIIMLDLIAFPLFVALVRKLPNGKMGDEKWSFGKFLAGIPVMSMVVVVGGLVGNFVQSQFTASSTAGLDEILTGSSFFWRVLYVGILAPIVEEIVFRKLLIDKLSVVGKAFAIFVSALCFGLFHGNFAQFFYAFALGIIWGVIYVRTGKIYISMAYHFIINMSTSAVGVILMGLVDEKVPGSELPFYLYVGMRMVLAILGVIVAIVAFKKFFVIDDEEGLKGGKLLKRAFSSWGLWIHYALCLVIFLISIMSSALSAAPKEKITEVKFTELITVENGVSAAEDNEVRIVLTEAGLYTFFFDWYNNTDPAFITGVRVEDQTGTSCLAVTGGRLSAEMNPIYLDEGEYNVIFTYLDSEESFCDYSVKYCLEPGESAEDVSCEYEKFGIDGTYKMNYAFTITKLN